MDQAEKLRNIIKKQEIEAAANNARVITVTSGKGELERQVYRLIWLFNSSVWEKK